jgi:hypothetical protein
LKSSSRSFRFLVRCSRIENESTEGEDVEEGDNKPEESLAQVEAEKTDSGQYEDAEEETDDKVFCFFFAGC